MLMVRTEHAPAMRPASLTAASSATAATVRVLSAFSFAWWIEGVKVARNGVFGVLSEARA